MVDRKVPDFVDKFVRNVIKTEGGYVNHPNDRGGPTNYGITERTARLYGYHGDIAKLPVDVAYHIYVERYFYNVGFDAVAKVSEKVAEELFDSGVNFGPGVPIIWFQRWLNVFNQQGKNYPDILVDGIIGKDTINAFKAFLHHRGRAGEEVMHKALNASQGARYLELAENRPANESFVYGWLANRVN